MLPHNHQGEEIAHNMGISKNLIALLAPQASILKLVPIFAVLLYNKMFIICTYRLRRPNC